MPKFIIGRKYGYAGTSSTKVVECHDLQEAKDFAAEFAELLVESWAEPVEEEGGL